MRRSQWCTRASPSASVSNQRRSAVGNFLETARGYCGTCSRWAARKPLFSGGCPTTTVECSWVAVFLDYFCRNLNSKPVRSFGGPSRQYEHCFDGRGARNRRDVYGSLQVEARPATAQSQGSHRRFPPVSVWPMSLLFPCSRRHSSAGPVRSIYPCHVSAIYCVALSFVVFGLGFRRCGNRRHWSRSPC